MVDGTGVQVIAEIDGERRPIALRMSDTLFRIGQEAVANAVRHANPSRLMIRLAWQENAVCLEVEDDGSGFVPGSGLSGFGIRGMRRRAQSVLATLKVESEPGTGTRVRVEAPLPPRVTLASWPGVLWKHTKDSWTHGRPARTANSHLYRG
jgi:signal transduction histidine kinase